MQTTLLSIAIGLILALLAALGAPHVVRWNDHRAFFEAEASRIVGTKIRIGGDIDAALLPFPSVTLRAVSIGPPGEDSRMRARSLRVELALGPLMRGELRATEMKLVAPQFNAGLDAKGQIDWPALGLGTEPLAIERLSVEDGQIALSDAMSKTRLTLEQFWFSGELRAAGPVRGKGAFVAAGKLYGYEVSAGRAGEEGYKVKLALRNDDRPLAVEAEGLLALDHGAPSFEGMLSLSRPTGITLPGGRALVYEPWRLISKVKAAGSTATLDEVAFQYGPEERAVALTGAAEFKFGAKPQLQGALSARQVDLDRMLATPETPRRVPLAALQAFADTLGSALRPSWPVKLSLNVDAMTVGGGSVRDVSTDVHSDGASWTLDKLEFRAPGFTQVKVNGRILSLGTSLGFTGAASIDASDPKNLLAWLTGISGAAVQFKPWRIKGDVTLGPDRIALEKLKTEFERGTVEGSMSYAWPAAGRPARLEGELRAADLDFDGVFAFGSSALSGLGLERPGEIKLAIDVGRARLAGFDARDLAARFSLDAKGLAIERLSVADLGDASFLATGRIQTSSPPGGSITVNLNARDLRGLQGLAERFTPLLAEPLRRLAARQKTASLQAAVSLIDGDGGSASGKVDLTGQVGVIRVTMTARASGKREAFMVTDPAALSGADVRLEGRFEANDGGPILALVGLDRLIASDDKRPARLDMSASGPLGRELRFETKLAAGAIDAAGSGVLKLPRDQPAVLDFDKFAGSVAGSKLQGRLALRFGDEPRVDGAIDVDALDAPAVIVAVIGAPPRRAAAPSGWSTEPIAASAAGFNGRIEFSAQRASFASWLTAQDLRGVARFNGAEVIFEDVAAKLGEGLLEGRLTASNGADGLSARLRAGLTGAELNALFPSAGDPPLSGRLTLQAELEGSGRSPAAFVGSFTGTGSLTLEQAKLAGLNPDVFGAVTRAMELGISNDGSRIRQFVRGALDNAGLPVSRASATIGINASQARLRDIVIKADGADLQANANLDLTDGTLDAAFMLNAPPSEPGGALPAVLVALKGALPAPTRVIDTNTLASWLMLHAVEQRSKQIDAMEQAARAAAAAAVPSLAKPADVPQPKPAAAAPAPRPAPRATVQPGSVGAQD